MGRQSALISWNRCERCCHSQGLPLRPEMLAMAMARQNSPRQVTTPHPISSPHAPRQGVSPSLSFLQDSPVDLHLLPLRQSSQPPRRADMCSGRCFHKVLTHRATCFTMTRLREGDAVGSAEPARQCQPADGADTARLQQRQGRHALCGHATGKPHPCSGNGGDAPGADAAHGPGHGRGALSGLLARPGPGPAAWALGFLNPPPLCCYPLQLQP